MRSLTFAALLLALPAFAADDKKKDDQTTKVTGTFTVPKEQASFEKLVLEIRLYEYDPRIADKAADLIEKVLVKDFKHEKGKETVQKFEVGAKGMLKEGKAYYLTVYVLDGDTRVARGDLEHDAGLGKVLTNGQPREVKAVSRPIGKK
ncbi:MAG: hypothetical protein MUF18_15440 [Fimbriiglobus sp.]|jgi:hypothetical protein|nr:hypothetical protein [Fimbriiglobus sp.]